MKRFVVAVLGGLVMAILAWVVSALITAMHPASEDATLGTILTAIQTGLSTSVGWIVPGVGIAAFVVILTGPRR